jgi:signal transduction histidine kinase
MAHELRQPLATQRALLELTLTDPDADMATWRELGRKILGTCEQQERLLEACLTLARSQSGLPRHEPVELQEIAAEALRTHDTHALERILLLEPAPTTGDPDLLKRLAANLVSNAIRHNIPGGQIKIKTGTKARRAVLGVTNTGPLVPPRELTRLFQPFERLSSNPDAFTPGLGLGLPIIQAITDAHGASLTVRPQPSGGLDIRISFPAIG